MKPASPSRAQQLAATDDIFGLGVRGLQSDDLEAGRRQAGALAGQRPPRGQVGEGPLLGVRPDPEQAGQLAEDVVTHDDVIGRVPSATRPPIVARDIWWF